MPTSLPKVTVSRVEAGAGFLITCHAHHCRLRTMRPFRHEADQVAHQHLAAHATQATASTPRRTTGARP